MNTFSILYTEYTTSVLHSIDFLVLCSFLCVLVLFIFSKIDLIWVYAHLLIICVGYKILFDALISKLVLICIWALMKHIQIVNIVGSFQNKVFRATRCKTLLYQYV
ncbi:hypothetical protein ACJX0J_013880, partial [Zea mays]